MLVAPRQGQPSNRFKSNKQGWEVGEGVSVFLTQEGTGEGTTQR